jgi:hypothetical protein
MAKRVLSKVSTNDLHTELMRRVKQRESLLRKRERVAAQLAEIDGELESFGVDTGALTRGRGRGRVPGGGRKRPRNEMNLVDALEKTLKGKQLGVTELAELVQKHGYKTTSPNFRTIVNQALINNTDRFKRVSRGLYTTK